MQTVFWVALGGAIGAVGRHLVGLQAVKLFGPAFPWGTLSVNVAGSFAMGVLIGLLPARADAFPAVRAFLAVGVLGGFTTFSAFSLDVAVLLERKANVAAAGYLTGSVTLSILALFAGLWLTRLAVQ